MQSETVTYDANSNIKTLMRYGKMNNGNYNAIDILDYTYDGGNRLYSIIDHGQNLVTEGAFDFKDDLINSFYAPEYWYNSNGALSYDANKGVSWIDYDKLGNPIRVQFTDHSITEHVYAADGRRLKTIHRTSIPQSNPLGIGVTASLTPAQTQSIDSLDYVGNFIYEKGQLKRYMFDDGYLKLYTNTFSPRFFIKDHLGNNRIVTDGSGNIQQNTNYYPYGGMTSISTGQGEQQFKYNGKEYDPMHGLNEYDYGARQYDPAIGKFTTMDPLCEKYYHISPYAYCGGNPVNAVDPDGKEPTPTEAAYIADHVYGLSKDLIGGWEEFYSNFTQNGLQYGLYQRKKKNGEFEYVLAFAGTNDLKDLQQDISQVLGTGEISQYGNAIYLGKQFALLYEGYEKTIVGHSFGGGLATVASMSTDIPAIVFNPTAITDYTKYKLDIPKQSNYYITNYVILGDPLSVMQNLFGLSLPGETKYINIPNTSRIPFINSYNAHLISNFKKYLSLW